MQKQMVLKLTCFHDIITTNLPYAEICVEYGYQWKNNHECTERTLIAHA